MTIAEYFVWMVGSFCIGYTALTVILKFDINSCDRAIALVASVCFLILARFQ